MIEEVGFIGLGVMGQPMALNMARAGVPLVVWNRTPARCEILRAAGAKVTLLPREVLRRTRITFMMLNDDIAIDAVLRRGTSEFGEIVDGRTIVNMGTTCPDYSAKLEAEIRAAGGNYVEAPISGSRKSAETGQLAVMTAGEADAAEDVRILLTPMCRDIVDCGAVPSALLMKLSINIFFISMVTGLVEAIHFAKQYGLNMQNLAAILDVCPMASGVSKLKTAKLLARDFEVQLSISEVLKSIGLIESTSKRKRSASPLTDVCHKLFSEAMALGLGKLDMAAVIHAIELRTKRVSSNGSRAIGQV